MVWAPAEYGVDIALPICTQLVQAMLNYACDTTVIVLKYLKYLAKVYKSTLLHFIYQSRETRKIIQAMYS